MYFNCWFLSILIAFFSHVYWELFMYASHVLRFYEYCLSFSICLSTIGRPSLIILWILAVSVFSLAVSRTVCEYPKCHSILFLSLYVSQSLISIFTNENILLIPAMSFDFMNTVCHSFSQFFCQFLSKQSMNFHPLFCEY